MARAEEGGCAKRRRRAVRAAWRYAGPVGTAGLLARAALILAPTLVGAQTADQAKHAAQDAIHKLDLQTELPHAQPPPNWHFNLPPEVLWVVAAIALCV